MCTPHNKALWVRRLPPVAITFTIYKFVMLEIHCELITSSQGAFPAGVAEDISMMGQEIALPSATGILLTISSSPTLRT